MHFNHLQGSYKSKEGNGNNTSGQASNIDNEDTKMDSKLAGVNNTRGGAGEPQTTSRLYNNE